MLGRGRGIKEDQGWKGLKELEGKDEWILLLSFAVGKRGGKERGICIVLRKAGRKRARMAQ